ncbi:1,4-alpha-glucan branching protein GlgB [Candidatus Chloroploca sp. M-50]|uniref:1,4-alpha-glucan branching enzyme GlgB n=1 Tax=Candidatus Chloroploca mongolica TaxID=2528176 RepID=A0ABS4D8L7_9CHLR|nr:1,4-alpha-glucan branching protein GlgB [Candidatus Chloroploca mongolica]MBP1465776.1 1,4-alpha-glucan branching protein GlgB [Candidatus Chloroploca mongolica]
MSEEAKKPRRSRAKKTTPSPEPVIETTTAPEADTPVTLAEPSVEAASQADEAVVAPTEDQGAPEPVASISPSLPIPIHVDRYPGSPVLTDDDIYIFNEGNHFRLYEKLGAHVTTVDGQEGTYFSVWAPNAEYIAVIGAWNNWHSGHNPLKARGNSGIWEAFVPGVVKGASYKFHVSSRFHAYKEDKTDPMGIMYEVSPGTASIVWDREYTWNDEAWIESRMQRQNLNTPMSIYEVHLGSWMRVPEEGGRSLSYREIAPRLAEHVKRCGFTHIELLPITEHPFFGSWGYQTTGFFAPTSRYGTPQDFMYFVDYLHQHGIGIILDWVPSHFPTDGFGLSYFDGTHLYEHADPRKGFHPDWGSYIFNYGRNEVRSFLISSALCWLDTFHIDGLRVDAVASMLYLDYSRQPGEWIPNQYGGNENIDAIMFLRQFNTEVYKNCPGVQTIAEESTAWPMVSRPTYVGGLGFGFKWDMGWMHDTLSYFRRDPVFRRFHHNELTFRGLYMFTENYVLALSHDEVVHGKGSLLDKMSGDVWQKFANLRLLYSYMYGQPGKKLIFMGSEFGQWREWKHDESLDWHLMMFPSHRGIADTLADLNRLYVSEPALAELDTDPDGYEWIDANDADNSTYSFLRKARSNGDQILVVMNATPIIRENYRVGVPRGGWWEELFNSDAKEYWGSGVGNAGGVMADDQPSHNRPFSLTIDLPPLGALFFKSRG